MEPTIKQFTIDIPTQKADLIEKLNKEVQRLGERPDVVAYMANQTFLDVLIKAEVESAGHEMPAMPGTSIQRKDGICTLIVIDGSQLQG